LRLIFFFLRILVLGVASFIVAFVYFSIASFYLSPQQIEHPLSMLSVGVLSTLIFWSPVDKLLKRGIRTAGFQSEPKSFERIRSMTDSLVYERQLIPAANLFLNTLSEELGLNSSAIFVKRGENFSPLAFQGRPLGDFKGFHLSPSSHLTHVLVGKPEGLKGLGPKEPPPKNPTTLGWELHQLQASFIFPLLHDSELFGFLAIGFKGGRSLTRVEIRFIRTLLPTLKMVVFKGMLVEVLEKQIQDFPALQSESLQSTKLSAMEQLATGIAHEIHNPLTIISGKAQVLLLKKTKTFDPVQVEEVLNTIVRQTKRASEVTRKLLMFTKTESEEKQEIDLEVILKDTLSLISYQMSLDQIQIEKDINASLPKFWGATSEIREIFMNLILNAIQATAEKGKIRIYLGLGQAGDFFQFSVEDYGAGIDEDKIANIFDPFYTTFQDGVGLGLYITERLVLKNGGKIKVESEKDKGSLFIVDLPLLSKNETRSKKPLSEVQNV